MRLPRTNKVTMGPRVKARVECGKSKFDAFVDSGSVLTIIDKQRYEALGDESKLETMVETTFTNIGTADSTADMEVAGAKVLRFRLDGKPFEWPCVVVTNFATDMVIGTDLLDKYKGFVNPYTQKLEFCEYKLEHSNVQLPKDEVVKGDSRRVVPAVVRGPKRNGTFLVTPKPDSLVQPGVYLVKEGKVNLLIHNKKASDAKLEKGTHATAEHVHEKDLLYKHQIVGFHPEVPEGTYEKMRGKRKPISSKKEKLINDLTTSVGRYLGQEKANQLKEVLTEFYVPISEGPYDIGCTDVVKHKLELRTEEPVFRPQFQVPEAHRKFLEETVRELEKKKCIEPDYDSPYNSAIFAVKKPHSDELRMVQDLRYVNACIRDDNHSFMSVNECLDRLGGMQAKYISAIDLKSAYWQMMLDEASRKLTAFTLPGVGKFHWRVSTMGLKTSPAAFTRLMEYVFRGMNNVVAYLDDLLIADSTYEEHLESIKKVFARLELFNLKVNLEKCEFAKEEMPYLGYTISAEGVRPGAEKTKAIDEYPEPDTNEGISRFIGMCNYYRQFVKNFTRESRQLTQLAKANSDWVEGTPLPESAKLAFRNLKAALRSRPLLTFPRPGVPFKLTTDASMEGLGAVLTQDDEQGKERVIGYASRALTPSEKNYSAYLLEAAGIVFGMEHFSYHLYDTPFLLLTDHKPLEGFEKMKLKKTQHRTLMRLIAAMNNYTFTSQYKPGKENVVADALSRAPVWWWDRQRS